MSWMCIGWYPVVADRFLCKVQCVHVVQLHCVKVQCSEGGKLTSNNVAGSSHDPLKSFAVASGAVLLVSRRKHEVFQNIFVNWCSDVGF